MKNTLLISMLLLVGCSSNPFVPEKQIVKIDKPIPYCPAPPKVVECQNYVDALTDEDRADPGKVAQAYKMDMMCYRANAKTLREILQRYEDTSLLLKDVEAMYDSLGQQYDTLLSPSPTPQQP